MVLVFSSGLAFAQPVMEDAYVDTQENTYTEVWIDDYWVGGNAYLDYSTLTIVEDAHHGSCTLDLDYGVIEYTPDQDYSGYDAVSYVITDEEGGVSEESWIFIYVEPDGSWTNSAPLIVGFYAVGGTQTGDVILQGIVVDEAPDLCTVTYGGAASGTTTPSYDGRFGKLFSSIGSGIADAQAQDDYNLLSNVASTYISSQ
jgi:hypothetical protein